jgi:hypothetical protein
MQNLGVHYIDCATLAESCGQDRICHCDSSAFEVALFFKFGFKVALLPSMQWTELL